MSSEFTEASSSEHRSSTVCFLCRQRKTKCDRLLPTCGFCIKAKVKCQYVERPKKRGLRAGYVSQLEFRLDQLETRIQEAKDARNVSPTQISKLTPSLSTDDGGRTPVRCAYEASGADAAIPPAKRRKVRYEPDAAVADLMTLPHEYIHALADLWFKETHPWCPILRREQIKDALAALPSPIDHIDDTVLKAVVALQIAYSSQAISLGYKGRYRLAEYLRSQVLNEALSKASLTSVQALLIMAVRDYGSDNITSTMSLLSVCRRMCENIGLFRRLLSQIEMQSPAQIGPPSISSSSDPDNAIPLAWVTLALDAVSSLGVSWRDVSAALIDHLSSVAYVSTPDLRDSVRAHTHLAAIGLQPVHSFIYDQEMSRYAGEEDEALAACDEIYHNLLTYVQSQPATSYTLLADGNIDFDPNLIHTTILSHASIIILYGRLVKFEDVPSSNSPLQRCLQACEELALAVRSISDADAEVNSPLLPTFLFVAARLKLITYRALKQEREAMFDTLMHGVNMGGRRWPLARRLDIVLRAAIVEVDTREGSALPESFWDLRKSHLDISDELKEWVQGYKHSLYVGALNGPYM